MNAPHYVDSHVGTRLRQGREHRGISQEKLGNVAGITFQQVQKYERGINRISASKLYEFAEALGVNVAFFFEGMPPKPRRKPPLSGRGRRST